MGDIVHGLPAAAYLKERLPGLQLSWLVEPAGIPLLEGNPAVDRVIVFPKRRLVKQLSSVSGAPATALEAWRFASDLRKLKFDAAIDLQGLLKSSLLAFLSGSNLRFGFKGTREGADRFLTHPLDIGDYFGHKTHVVEHNLRLAEFAARTLERGLSDKPPVRERDGDSSKNECSVKTGGSFGKDDVAPGENSSIYKEAKFPLPQPSRNSVEKVESLLVGRQSPGSPLVVLIPGTTWTSKIWPLEHWVALTKLLLERISGPVFLLGGESERQSNQQLASGFGERVVDLSCKTEIQDLAAIFARSSLVIGADTGPLHLAAATGVPQVLAIFGSTPAGRNGPYGPRSQSISLELDCQPCFKKTCPLGTLACLKDLSPEAVLARALELI